MEKFQERMLNEYRELYDRVEKLEKFINENPLFDKLDKQERIYQVWQLTGMKEYRAALGNRLIHQGLMNTGSGIPDGE